MARWRTVDTQRRPAGELSGAVAELCDRLRPQVSAHTAAGFDQVVRRLSAPLQVAVAGRIKSGKSTLVNALIGRKVAPTAVGECTRLVTRFHYGTVDRVELVFTDGSRQALPFDADGGIPADLGVDMAKLSHLDAYLTNAVLRDLTVIDTPGLASADQSSVARTQRLVGPASMAAEPDAEQLDRVSAHAVAGAEAVVYVVTQGVRADDTEALAAFTAATASREAGPVNAIGVLNKVDTIAPETVEGADGDVWQAASLLARKQAALLRPRVADVIPVIGLLAQTCEAGEFTSADGDALRALARVEESEWQTMTVAADIFTSWKCEVPEGVRHRLLETLDLHGVDTAVRLLRADPSMTVGSLQERLVASSGLHEMRGRLDGLFRARADGIKASAALATIGALARDSGDPGERQRVHDAIEVVLSRPEAHQLRLLDALTLVSSGTVELPDDLLAEVLRVGGGGSLGSRLGMDHGDEAACAAYALERAGWWRSFASFGATPAQGRVAHVVHRAYFLMWQELRQRSAGS